MDISQLCKTSQNAQQNLPPPVRFNLYNPYIGSKYTKYDLDMRRKAEILQYKSNVSNTQTNKLTKKQIWSLISNGGYNQLTQTQLNNAVPVGNNIRIVRDCSLNNLIPTPTSSCNVPGPIVYLYNDETVPLYNYNETENNRSYGIINQTNASTNNNG